VSALPLDWLPFKPEQTDIHYAVHAVYRARGSRDQSTTPRCRP
jgi:hypothetical protein